MKCSHIPLLVLRPPTAGWGDFFSLQAAGKLLIAALALFGTSSRSAVIDHTPPGVSVTANYNGSAVVMSLSGSNPNAVNSTTDDLMFSSGVVAWSSGATIHSYVYDAARARWVGTNSNQGPTSDLSTADGVVAWSTSSGTFYRIYDPAAGRWVTESGPGPVSEPKILNNSGVVAWSSAGTVYYRVYDPTRSGWKSGNFASGNTFDLVASNGVVAWTAGTVSVNLHLRIYDPGLGLWKGQDVPTAYTSSILIQGATVTTSTAGGGEVRGYNPGSGTWNTGGGNPLPYFAVSTNSGNAPLTVTFIDMSIGGVSWEWDFGDGLAGSSKRSVVHRYSALGRFTAVQRVNQVGASKIITTDIIPPTGTIQINNGDAVTTNQTVTLGLTASDGGLVTDMRFSNNAGANWSTWEPFQLTKIWLLPAGSGTKTVSAQFRDAAGNTSSPPATASIQLETAAPPTANFATVSVGEGAGSASVAVTLDHGYSLPVSVRFSTASGTATASLDYTPTNGLLVFAPNTIAASITVPIVSDGLVELNETIFLEFTGATNAMPGPSRTLTILDDDAPIVSFGSAGFTAAENSGVAAIAVRLSAPSGRPVAVSCEATNGTALSGSDFVSTNGVVTFAPGETNASFLVTLLDDGADELSETVALTLSHPTNAVFGLQATATLTITDDDKPLVFFASPTYSFFETNGIVRMSVRLSKPFSQNVEVDYEAIGGTATPGDDYIFPLGTLTIGAGETNREIAINLRNDTQVEPDENIRMQITSVRGASPGPRLEADVIIFDDDGAPRPVAPSVNTNGLFEVAFTGRTGRVFTIEASTNLLNWSPVATLTNTTGTIRFADPDSPGIPSRYYRSWAP